MKEKLKLNEKVKNRIREGINGRRDNAVFVRKSVLKSVMLILGILILAVGGVSWYVYNALQPLDPNDHSKRKVEIPMGSGTTTISMILKENGIIKNAKIFKYYLKFNNETGFQAGRYEMSPAMTMRQISAELKTGRLEETIVKKILIPEGKRLDEIATIIANETGRKQTEVMKKMNSQSFVKELQAEHPDLITDVVFEDNVRYPLEGYLFPATYGFADMEPSVDAIVRKMVEKMADVLTDYLDAIEASDMTVHQTLTLASIIEKEASEKTDRSKISGVFHNRMKIGMKLDSDVTVLYALGEHKEQVLYKDLEVDSPYNTYRNSGWMPGPIASPGEDSIWAALNPAKTTAKYFIATPEGEGIFADTLEEQTRNINEHLRQD